jgi:hypothetical protein
MKTFNEYITESKDTFEYHLGKLHKTAKTIYTHKSYGGHANTNRGYELATRYDSILDKIKQNHRKEWWAYCEKMGWAHNHDGRDMYA